MKKELRLELGEEHIYVNQLSDKCQRATKRISPMGNEYGAYSRSIQTTLQDFG